MKMKHALSVIAALIIAALIAGIPRPSNAAATLTYQSQTAAAPGFAQPVDFGTLSVGASAADRIIVICILYDTAASRQINTINVGGTNYTPTYADAPTTGANDGTAVLILPDSTANTSYDIQLNMNFGPDSAVALIYTLNGVGLTGTPSAEATNYLAGVNADPQSLGTSITVPSGGVGLVFGGLTTSGSSPMTMLPATWDAGTNDGGHDTQYYSGAAPVITSGTPVTPGASWSPSVSGSTSGGFMNGFGFSKMPLRAMTWAPASSLPVGGLLTMGVGN